MPVYTYKRSIALMYHRTGRNSICLKHKSICTVPFTVLEGKIGLHNQTSIVQFQKQQKPFFVVVVFSQIVRNVVALIHFSARYATP